MREALERFTTAGRRKVSGGRGRPAACTKSSYGGPDAQTVRMWAAENGIDVNTPRADPSGSCGEVRIIHSGPDFSLLIPHPELSSLYRNNPHVREPARWGFLWFKVFGVAVFFHVAVVERALWVQ
jgi:hypothetical protein